MKKAISTLILSTLFLFAHSQNNKPVLTLPAGHEQFISSIDFSSNGKLMVTGSHDNSFIIWDAKTGFIIRRVVTDKPILQVLITPDGLQLITVSGQIENIGFGSNEANVLQLWDLTTGELVKKLPFTASSGFKFLPYSGYLLALNYSDNLTAKRSTLLDIIIKPDKDDDKDEEDEELSPEMKKILEAMEKMTGTDKNSDEEKIAYKKLLEVMMNGGTTSNISLIDFKTLKVIASLNHSASNVKVTCQNNKEFILTQTEDVSGSSKKMIVWEVKEFIRHYTAKGNMATSGDFPIKENIELLSASQVNGFFANDANKKTIQLWQLGKKEPFANLKPTGNELNDIQFSSSGDYVYTLSGTKPYKFIDGWNTNTLKQTTSIQLPTGYISEKIYLPPGGDYFAVPDFNDVAKLYLNGESAGYFRGRSGTAGEIGFTLNDQEVYIRYNAVPDNSSLFQNFFTAEVESDALENSKVLTKNQKEKLVKEKVDKTLAILPKPAKGVLLHWDLLRGGAYIDTSGVKQTINRTLSADKKYGLLNVKFVSANKQIQNQLKLLSVNAGTDEDDDEKDKRKIAANKKMLEISREIEKQFYLDSLNGSLTKLINKTTKDSISLINIDSSDWVMLLGNGYYMASRNGARALSYTRNLEVLPFQQFDIQYNRPDLVLKAIGKADKTLIEAYRNAYLKRIKKLDIDTTKFNNDFNIPEADFGNRDKIESKQTINKLNVTIVGNDKKVALDRYNIWINEVPLFGRNGKSISGEKSMKLTAPLEVTLSEGINRIETSVTNISGVESYRTLLIVKYEPTKPVMKKVFFIGIGINQFADSAQNLKYCEKDIRDLAQKFKEKYGTALQTELLFNKEVTLENIKALKQKLLLSNEDDKIIIAFSGHGLLSSDYNYYLSSFNVDFNAPEKNGIPYDELENLMDGIKARKKVLLLDACHSGEVDKDDLIAINKMDTSKIKKGFKPVAYKNEGHLGLKNSFELMQDLFLNVGRGTGATIISAAAGTQFALEKNELKNGVFTYSILEAMKQYPTMKISELKAIVGKRVEELTKGLQKPTSRNETIAVDWEVW